MDNISRWCCIDSFVHKFVELFDYDKLGDDKPFRSTNIDIVELSDEGPLEDVLIPLKYGKWGKINISADFQTRVQDDSNYGREDSQLREGIDDVRGGKNIKD